MAKINRFVQVPIKFLTRIVRTPTKLTSLDHLRNPPPPVSSGDTRNAYIPSNRRTIYRELLQDASVILPSERSQFEELALSLKTKIDGQFQLLQNELLLNYQPIERFVSQTTPDNSEPQTPHPVSLRTPSDTERLDNEFWILQRLSQLAKKAGFFEVSRDQLEHACQPKAFRRNKAVLSYIQPKDYDVLRFWVRGVHPCCMESNPTASPAPPTTSFVSRATGWLSKSVHAMKHLRQTVKGLSKSSLSHLLRIGSLRSNRSVCGSNKLCFADVLMSMHRKDEKSLRIKFFHYVPASKSSGGNFPTDNLSYLLPHLRYLPLTVGGRVLLLSSALTAIGCLGLVAPLAWLLTVNPDLVIAWSITATAAAGGTASLVWARYWRGQAQLEDWIKQMHYQCGSLSGVYAVNNLVSLAREEEYKAALLTYALLLRPTEDGCPLSPVQLGIRAESWLAKRLQPQSHISTMSSLTTSFTGGSGPLFDLYFRSNAATATPSAVRFGPWSRISSTGRARWPSC